MSSGHRWTRAQAPGKVILMGEHAAVYGKPALVTALGLQTQADVAVSDEAGSESVRLELPDLNCSVELEWSAIDALREAAFAQSRAHLEQGADFVALDQLAPNDQMPAVALFVAAALGEVSENRRVAMEAAQLETLRRRVRTVRVSSKAPLGAGCGSSAAVATTTVAAFDRALAEQGSLAAANVEAIENMALQVERYQHGRPSGVDTAAVLRGGALLVRRQEKAAAQPLEIEQLVVAPGVLAGLSIVYTGEAAESTGAVVDAIRRRRAQAERSFDAHFDTLGDLTERLASALVEGSTAEIGPVLRAGERHLEAIGVVPPAVVDLVRAIERCGAAAKVSGAGSLAGPGAGVVLVYDPDGKLDWADLGRKYEHVEPMAVKLGGPGLKVTGP